MDDKKHRVANFHDVTLHSFLEIIGAMGLQNPSELHRDQIYRRLDVNTVKTFAEIYTPVDMGCFLTGNVPERYQKAWDQAQADRF